MKVQKNEKRPARNGRGYERNSRPNENSAPNENASKRNAPTMRTCSKRCPAAAATKSDETCKARSQNSTDVSPKMTTAQRISAPTEMRRQRCGVISHREPSASRTRTNACGRLAYLFRHEPFSSTPLLNRSAMSRLRLYFADDRERTSLASGCRTLGVRSMPTPGGQPNENEYEIRQPLRLGGND